MCVVGGVVENEVCQAVVVVMPMVQKDDKLNWIGGIDVRLHGGRDVECVWQWGEKMEKAGGG